MEISGKEKKVNKRRRELIGRDKMKISETNSGRVYRMKEKRSIVSLLDT